jgi:hypothetical protein
MRLPRPWSRREKIGELLGGAHLGEGPARRLLGDLAYRSEKLGETLASAGVTLVTERPHQHGRRQQAEVAFSILKRVFGIERILANTLVGWPPGSWRR